MPDTAPSSPSQNGPLAVSLDGITPLPHGHIGTIKTYLEMARPAAPVPDPAPLPFRLDRLGGSDTTRYRSVYAMLGRQWLWWTRLMLSDTELAAILADEAVVACAICVDGRDIGLLELDFRTPGEVDLAFLGLDAPWTDRGWGRLALAHAIARAWQKADIRRLTVNTCTFDSPRALRFYRAAGFGVVRQAIEIVPDPRLSGLLPCDAAPHVPLLGGGPCA